MLRATREEVEQYLARMGKRGAATISTLGKLQVFRECMESELGFSLLCDTINRYEELLDRVAELNATEEEKVEFKATKKFLLAFAERLYAYNQRVGDIKKKGN